MPKRLSIIILMVIILASQLSCVKLKLPTLNSKSSTVVSPSQASVTYTNSDNGFTIERPKTWEDISSQFNSPSILAAFRAPDACDSFKENFLITKDPGTTDLSIKAYFDLNKPRLSQNGDKYTPLSTNEVTINGKQAIKHDYTIVSNNITVHQQIYFIINNKICYAIIFSCAQSCYDKCASDFGKISNSLKFTKSDNF